MRVVNIEDFFHPNAGYQINILSKYMANKGIETYIVTSDMERVPENLTSFFGKDNIDFYDKEYERTTGVKVIRVPVWRFVSSRAIFKKELFRIVDELSPDILYVHGNDTFVGMRYIWKQQKLKYALITDSHMLEMASVNRFNKLFRKFYKHFFTPRIVKNNLTVIRTQDDPYVNKCLGIPLTQAPWISYGSDTLLFYPDRSIKKQFKKKNHISKDAFVILYAGKLDEAKGGLFLAETIQEKFHEKREIVFVIVGNTSGEYGRKVDATLKKSQNRILRFPTQQYSDLAYFYKSADLMIFPKQCSLSFYDAQACGVPVISENNNINATRCSHGNGSVFVPGNQEDFRLKIQKYIAMDFQEYHTIQRNAYEYIKTYYDYDEKANEYINEIKKAMVFFGNQKQRK